MSAVGKVTDVRLAQEENADEPILFTLLGKVTEVIFEPLTKFEGMVCTLLPMVTLVILLVDIPPLVERLMAFQVS